jgi:hypothetical protein
VDRQIDPSTRRARIDGPSPVGRAAQIRYAALLGEEVRWMPKMSGKQKARIWCVAFTTLAPTILATAELIRTLVER